MTYAAKIILLIISISVFYAVVSIYIGRSLGEAARQKADRKLFPLCFILFTAAWLFVTRFNSGL